MYIGTFNFLISLIRQAKIIILTILTDYAFYTKSNFIRILLYIYLFRLSKFKNFMKTFQTLVTEELAYFLRNESA